jgi:pimeloyl-ACP methyl ester carboxylesterase
MGSMETVTSRDSTPIAYERGGEGPPLVLVHGTTSDHLTWELVLPELQKHFTVYTMDRRGRGESGGGDGSRIHVTWNRTGVGLKGRMLIGIIKLSGGKPVAASIKAGLDKMREQQPQSGKQADLSVYSVQARRKQ